MSANRPKRLLTVCLGNHCRSPLAAVILARLGGPAVEVRSAGLRDKWAGHPAHPAMISAAAARGYDLTIHRGVHLNQSLMQWADTILAMDTTNLDTLQELADPDTTPKLDLYLDRRDIPDPWGKPPEAFTAVADLLIDGAIRHLP